MIAFCFQVPKGASETGPLVGAHKVGPLPESGLISCGRKGTGWVQSAKERDWVGAKRKLFRQQRQWANGESPQVAIPSFGSSFQVADLWHGPKQSKQQSYQACKPPGKPAGKAIEPPSMAGWQTSKQACKETSEQKGSM